MAEGIPPARAKEEPRSGTAGTTDRTAREAPSRTASASAAFPSSAGSPGGPSPEPASAPVPGNTDGKEAGASARGRDFGIREGGIRESGNGAPGWRYGTGQAYAAIDLGTNNCRLLIAKPSGDNFVVVDAFSRVVRLGEGLAQTGELSGAAMDRALAALHVCADKLRRRNVHLARSVATEACRRATNGAAFIERVREETGIALDIISAQEEARLAVLGCHILLEQGQGPAMIFDIGGGSTELVLIENGPTIPRILDWQSVPWGVVSLSETCGAEGATADERAARYGAMRRIVSDSFSSFADRIMADHGAFLDQPRRLLGTSGTVTTLASLHLDLPHYDRNMVDGLILPTEAMRGISARLSTLSPEERRRLPCIGKERADLVVAGCAILESILDIWPADRLGVADRGIREGILRSLMAAGVHSGGSLRRARGL